jgi:DNA-binding NarL/FixJ family response regulator
MYYTRQTCSLIAAEFSIGCIRRDSVEQLAEAGERLDDLCLLIVDERLADDLLQRPTVYRSIARDASIALAYRSMGVARAFYRRVSEDRHGHIGYLAMGAPLEVWLSSIRLLLHREYYLPAGLVAAPAESVQGRGPCSAGQAAASSALAEDHGRLAQLTRRELEVLRLVAKGRSNKLIARELGITEHTVKLHVHNLALKLEVSNRTEAASLYLAQKQGDAGSRT